MWAAADVGEIIKFGLGLQTRSKGEWIQAGKLDAREQVTFDQRELRDTLGELSNFFGLTEIPEVEVVYD